MNKIPGMTKALAERINAIIEEGEISDIPGALTEAMGGRLLHDTHKEFVKEWEEGVDAALKALDADEDDEAADFAINGIQPYVEANGEIRSDDIYGGSATYVWQGGYKWEKLAKKKLGGQTPNVQRERSSVRTRFGVQRIARRRGRPNVDWNTYEIVRIG